MYSFQKDDDDVAAQSMQLFSQLYSFLSLKSMESQKISLCNSHIIIIIIIIIGVENE